MDERRVRSEISLDNFTLFGWRRLCEQMDHSADLVHCEAALAAVADA